MCCTNLRQSKYNVSSHWVDFSIIPTLAFMKSLSDATTWRAISPNTSSSIAHHLLLLQVVMWGRRHHDSHACFMVFTIVNITKITVVAVHFWWRPLPIFGFSCLDSKSSVRSCLIWPGNITRLSLHLFHCTSLRMAGKWMELFKYVLSLLVLLHSTCCSHYTSLQFKIQDLLLSFSALKTWSRPPKLCSSIPHTTIVEFLVDLLCT